MYPTYLYHCSTPRCLNRNVFCKPQDPVLVIPLNIYLFASETLKYNMDSYLPGFLVVPYEKYNLISCFLSMFCIFCFLKEYQIWLFALHLKNKKNIFMCAQVPPYFIIYSGGNSGNRVKVNFGSELLLILRNTSKYMRATFNLCQSSF